MKVGKGKGLRGWGKAVYRLGPIASPCRPEDAVDEQAEHGYGSRPRGRKGVDRRHRRGSRAHSPLAEPAHGRDPAGGGGLRRVPRGGGIPADRRRGSPAPLDARRGRHLPDPPRDHRRRLGPVRPHLARQDRRTLRGRAPAPAGRLRPARPLAARTGVRRPRLVARPVPAHSPASSPWTGRRSR